MYGKEFGVMFGEKHSYRDYGLILSEKDMGAPEPRTNMIDVPLRDGSIDMTDALTKDIKYKDRQIKLTFHFPGGKDKWADKMSELQNALTGKRMPLIFDDDISYYYDGRITVNEWQSVGSTGKIVVDITADPFKYDLISSAAEWEWDTFDFETGIINEGGNIEVNGTATVKIIGRRKRSYPIITASEAMTVTYDKETFNLKKGENKVYDIIFMEGENELTFKGTGTVSVDYIGGSL